LLVAIGRCDDYETRWQKCAAMGLMGVLAPEEQGGWA